MPLIKKKISEFPLADSLKGLYTIGYKIIDGIKTSVKVSLEDIQTAYQDVVNAIKKSEEATSNANNAAVTAEEKAAAANVAAQEAEKIANNPTYIGKDHYVYVYNKDTGSFDKTDIYCKGEPGSSFRVAGEYATLEALKSAVPDGSAVDGFMAVGTEAPYDYYAWVSSAGGNNPNPSPDGKYLLLSDGTPLLLANEEPILLADSGERVASNGEWVNQGKIGGIDEAPTDGKAYGRKNGDWAEVPAKSDVLTKTNSESFTPTSDYQPATKKYADNINHGKVINVSVGTYLVTNKNERDREAIDLINAIFGSVDNLKEIILDIIANHTKYYFHSYNSKDNCIELSSIYSYHNPETEEYNLQCNISYYTNNGPVSKRMGFKLMPNDEDCVASIEDILVSDNLTTLTKKTAAEYDAIGSKDANTAYCVTV